MSIEFGCRALAAGIERWTAAQLAGPLPYWLRADIEPLYLAARAALSL